MSAAATNPTRGPSVVIARAISRMATVARGSGTPKSRKIASNRGTMTMLTNVKIAMAIATLRSGYARVSHNCRRSSVPIST